MGISIRLGGVGVFGDLLDLDGFGAGVLVCFGTTCLWTLGNITGVALGVDCLVVDSVDLTGFGFAMALTEAVVLCDSTEAVFFPLFADCTAEANSSAAYFWLCDVKLFACCETFTL